MAQAISASAQRAAARRRQKASAGSSRTARKRTGGGRSGIRWDRVARAALLGTLGIVLLLYISPLHRWITQRSLATQETHQLQQLQQQNRELRTNIKRLHNPSALEAEARRLGMVRRGEREYVVSGLPGR
ncbi:MAG TPA: septum formation initiator family protein [Thermoleophilaceae bacterium]|nr:septum formation initiator family protein [Thermoleophilaceae bacterium]